MVADFDPGGLITAEIGRRAVRTVSVELNSFRRLEVFGSPAPRDVVILPHGAVGR
jgi:hypothetical protein